MNSLFRNLTLGSLLSLAIAAPAMAQAHYLPGVYPLQNQTTMAPYPGVYFSEIILNYSGDLGLERNLLRGRVPFNVDLHQSITAPLSSLMWQTGEKFLGADYGVSVIVPFQNNNLGSAVELGLLSAGRSRNSGLALGDIYVSPLMLGWHGEQHDVLFSYGVWLPTGRYSAGADNNVGRGFATHQLELGGSYYLDKERTWSLNAVGTFEASTSNAVLNPGNYFTLDWGIFKQLDENWKIGLTGYDTRQLSAISGLPRGFLSNFTNSADAIGGEIGVTIPEANYLSITAKFSHEYNSFGRFGGNVGSLTFSIPIEMELPQAPAKPAETAPETPAPAPAQETAPEAAPENP